MSAEVKEKDADAARNLGTADECRFQIDVKEIVPVIVLSVILSVLFFAPYFHLFFIYDDIPTLRISVQSLGVNFVDVFSPMSNGFWRPLNRLLLMGSTSVFGMSPFALHCLGVLIHIANGLLLFLFVRYAMGLDVARSLLGTALFQISLAGCLAVIQPGNFADLTALTGVLIALNSTFVLQGWRSYTGLFIGLLVGYLAKEVFIVIPAVIALAHYSGYGWQTLLEASRKVALCVVLSLIYLVGLIYSLSQIDVTYVSDGRLDLNGIRAIRRFSDYMISIFFPYLHVFTFPVIPIVLPHWMLWGLRFVLLVGLCYLVFTIVVDAKRRRFYAPLVFASLFLLLPSFIAAETASRYLYIPSAFAFAFHYRPTEYSK
ncbi:MAG: hypothetical protein JJU11_14890 [Candidatus Sumerlaeia bacterium]|nr:hypothetical protein [Candidatus Sumerlaeia bacterium]